MKKNLLKYLHRLIFAVFTFLFFQVTSSMEGVNIISAWSPLSTAHLVFVVFTVMVLWELISFLFRYLDDKLITTRHLPLKLVQLFFVCNILILPFILLSSYFVIYHIDVWFEGQLCEDPVLVFWQTSLKSEVFLWLVMGYEMLGVYYKYTKQADHERALIQKELLLSQFQSLKNQVNPHFLFNSFSVLASLIDEDPRKASRFLSRLSKMYRYILENGEANLVSLAEELAFLNDYLFLLETRHEDSIKVDLKLSKDIDHFLLPTLSLQMLIENAVKHNNFSQRNPLRVEVYQEGSSYLVVQNRLNHKKSAKLSTKIGLENVRKRFDLHFKKKVIVDHNEAYFTVKLPLLSTIPLAT